MDKRYLLGFAIAALAASNLALAQYGSRDNPNATPSTRSAKVADLWMWGSIPPNPSSQASANIRSPDRGDAVSDVQSVRERAGPR